MNRLIIAAMLLASCGGHVTDSEAVGTVTHDDPASEVVTPTDELFEHDGGEAPRPPTPVNSAQPDAGMNHRDPCGDVCNSNRGERCVIRGEVGGEAWGECVNVWRRE
jgi:hypothetical protein